MKKLPVIPLVYEHGHGVMKIDYTNIGNNGICISYNLLRIWKISNCYYKNYQLIHHIYHLRVSFIKLDSLTEAYMGNTGAGKNKFG